MRVVDAVGEGLLERFAHLPGDVVDPFGEDFLAESAFVDFRTCDHRAGHDVHDRDDRDEPLLTEHPPVFQGRFGQVTDARSVDVDETNGCVSTDHRALLVEIDRDAVIHHEDATRVDAHALRHRGIRHQVSPLSVHGHDEARFHQVVDEAQLPGGRVPGNVHQSISLVHHRRAEFGQAIDDAIDGVFVSRDQRRCQHHGVRRPDGNRMITIGDPRQDSHRLPLRPGADQYCFVVG